MQLLISRRGLIQPQAHIGNGAGQLRVQLAPFAQPKIRQIMVVTLLDQLAVRLLVFQRILEEIP